MDRDRGPAARLVDLALGRPPLLGRTRLVCLDGPAGSGKTTLATGMAEAAALRGVTVSTVHMDDVYEGWTGLAAAGERLRRSVVEPVGAGRSGEFRRYDWGAARLDGPVTVPPRELLLVEGVGAARAAYADRISLLVWVDAPHDVRRARGVERDGAAFAARWEQWARDERTLHQAERTQERADVHLDGVTGRLWLTGPRGPRSDGPGRRPGGAAPGVDAGAARG